MHTCTIHVTIRCQDVKNQDVCNVLWSSGCLRRAAESPECVFCPGWLGWDMMAGWRLFHSQILRRAASLLFYSARPPHETSTLPFFLTPSKTQTLSPPPPPSSPSNLLTPPSLFIGHVSTASRLASPRHNDQSDTSSASIATSRSRNKHLLHQSPNTPPSNHNG
jgi:hypothetical protein